MRCQRELSLVESWSARRREVVLAGLLHDFLAGRKIEEDPRREAGRGSSSEDPWGEVASRQSRYIAARSLCLSSARAVCSVARFSRVFPIRRVVSICVNGQRPVKWKAVRSSRDAASIGICEAILRRGEPEGPFSCHTFAASVS